KEQKLISAIAADVAALKALLPSHTTKRENRGKRAALCLTLHRKSEETIARLHAAIIVKFGAPEKMHTGRAIILRSWGAIHFPVPKTVNRNSADVSLISAEKKDSAFRKATQKYRKDAQRSE
ncbi:MAG: hypothetical protein V1644_03145, partial [Candidatus Micrarchaeota archaeon]